MHQQNNGIARGMGMQALQSWLTQPSTPAQQPINTDANSMPNAQAPVMNQMVNPNPTLQDSLVGGSFGHVIGDTSIMGTGAASYPSQAPTGHL